MKGPSRPLDQRTHAYRRDVADIALAGRIFAPHYARPELAACTGAGVMLRASPDGRAQAVSQLLRGEGFGILDLAGGWAWGRCLADDYVGYLPAAALGTLPEPTHRVTVPLALVFSAPDIKAPTLAQWSIGALFAAREVDGFLDAGAGFVHPRHAAPIGERAADPVAVAERLIGQPYLWGGRGQGGIDCSGLVQLALQAAGIACPRDSDMQQAALGEPLAAGMALRRGDLVFFPGHVGLMVDGERLIHANAHWMAVAVEPLVDVVARLAHLPEPILARKRLA